MGAVPEMGVVPLHYQAFTEVTALRSPRLRGVSGGVSGGICGGICVRISEAPAGNTV